MSLVRISGPPELCVSLAEIKAQCRVADEDSDQDALLVGLARSAQDSIEGNAGWLGRSLTISQWRLTLDAFPPSEVIVLPLPPCQSVDSLTYIDPDGAEQVITDYVVYGIGGATPPRLAHAYGQRWPSTRRQGDAVSVTFTCGYGDHNDVPESVRAAILLQVHALYDGCSNDDAINALLMPHRTW
jgi:uncharacterized phiE125 gp8 family phage protein